ncbi:MAG: hypothetical protein K0A94_09430, partial [Desulfuromonadales bacterium]|nr:hypothetical protein [Desulfuromonadales bacterium]
PESKSGALPLGDAPMKEERFSSKDNLQRQGKTFKRQNQSATKTPRTPRRSGKRFYCFNLYPFFCLSWCPWSLGG